MKFRIFLFKSKFEIDIALIKENNQTNLAEITHNVICFLRKIIR